MNNPIAGQDFNVILHSNEDLTDATVTIEYRNSNGKTVTDIIPDAVNVETGDILWAITPDLTQMGGTWKIKAKIVTAVGKVYYNANEVSVTFDKKF
jgi:hypothetical protein